MFEYSLLKNKSYSLEEIQDEARLLLNSIIEKYSVPQQNQVSGFVACIDYLRVICFFILDE